MKYRHTLITFVYCLAMFAIMAFASQQLLSRIIPLIENRLLALTILPWVTDVIFCIITPLLIISLTSKRGNKNNDTYSATFVLMILGLIYFHIPGGCMCQIGIYSTLTNLSIVIICPIILTLIRFKNNSPASVWVWIACSIWLIVPPFIDVLLHHILKPHM